MLWALLTSVALGFWLGLYFRVPALIGCYAAWFAVAPVAYVATLEAWPSILILAGQILLIEVAGFLALNGGYLGALMVSAARSRHSKATIRSAPGNFLAKCAAFVFPRKACDRVFDPVISDMQSEYFEALKQGNILHSRWIWARGHALFWLAVLSYLGVSVVHVVKTIWVATK